jgi:predicted nucleic acid-binding protein
MLVVLDTDVVIAGVRSSSGAARVWLDMVFRLEVSIAISVPLMLQYEAVLKRDEHLAAAGISIDDAGKILDALSLAARHVDIQYLWRPVLKDPTDEMVLEAAINSGAEKLLTFNMKDFKGADRFGICVETPGDALHAWRKRASKGDR